MELGKLEDYDTYRSIDINDDFGKHIACIEMHNFDKNPVFVVLSGARHEFEIADVSAILDRMKALKTSGM